jgi:putative hydrolase of the HAD superfamily
MSARGHEPRPARLSVSLAQIVHTLPEMPTGRSAGFQTGLGRRHLSSVSIPRVSAKSVWKPAFRPRKCEIYGFGRRTKSQTTARPSIQAITFDVGGTLIEVWPSVGHVYAEVAARHGIKGLSARSLDRRLNAAWRAATDFSYSRSDWAALVDATFHGLTDQPPSQTFFAELYARFAEPDAWRIYEDVILTLQALAARGLKLGVISNWDERLRPLLERLKLGGYFDSIIVSREVGSCKPARGIFEHAVRKLGLPPEAVLHVGDSLAMDVRGAPAAGLSGLLLQRTGGAAKAGQIKSLRALC